MSFTRTVSLRILKIAGIVIFAALIIAYATWRSLNYVRGPQINVLEPVNGSTIARSSVIIHGRVLRAADLTLDGRQISVDEQGDFNETVIVFPGMNILTLAAKDQFGRSTVNKLQLIGSADLNLQSATSTGD